MTTPTNETPTEETPETLPPLHQTLETEMMDVVENGDMAKSDGVYNFLHSWADGEGLVGLVYDNKDGERVYHAAEYTYDDEGWSATGGYVTTEKHWYMGDRYRIPEMWGEYFSEVFG